MPPDPAVFEKLGSFYLGKTTDGGTPLLYDSRDLVTHAVCVGMTGSGKTGLCLALLEEAAMDDIPAIIIDPKGDLGNLLLTFPELRPEDFRPWIVEEDAVRKGMDADAWAARQAQTWREGLAAWGQSGERIRALKGKAEFAIYTPGSSAGIPVNLVDAFHAPEGADEEALAEHALTSVAGLLGLLGSSADPSKSREGSFLSAVLITEWKAGRSVDLPGLISKIQNPPFDKVGVMDLESFYPEKARFEMVLALNTLLSSPGFAMWQAGEPLDIGKFLHTGEGKPRHAIFSIAHLDDAQRMFFVTLLLNEVVAWMRKQSGTTSLRALVYMDEIFGYFPPVANPPSKLPLLTLLKQARAFGVGVVLATQNPVDLDYKGLANAGTWFIGRLQTDRDKARVIEGLMGASSALSKADLEKLMSGLGSRKFLLNNVHDDGPVVFESRWVMSYLRGPLTRDQIKTLMSGNRPEVSVAPAAPVGEPAASTQPPALPPGVPQVFLSSPKPLEPRLIGAATVRFADVKAGIEETREVLLAAGIPATLGSVNWADAEVLDLRLETFAKSASPGSEFLPLPSGAAQAKNYAVWEKDFARWLDDNQRLNILTCKQFNLYSRAGESDLDFTERVKGVLEKEKVAAQSQARQKLAVKVMDVDKKIARAENMVEKQKANVRDAVLKTAISVGTAILSSLTGGKLRSATNINRAGSAARGVSRAMREGSDVGVATESLEALRAEKTRLEGEFEKDSAALAAQFEEPAIASYALKPARGGITVRLVALGWI